MIKFLGSLIRQIICMLKLILVLEENQEEGEQKKHEEENLKEEEERQEDKEDNTNALCVFNVFSILCYGISLLFFIIYI